MRKNYFFRIVPLIILVLLGTVLPSWAENTIKMTFNQYRHYDESTYKMVDDTYKPGDKIKMTIYGNNFRMEGVEEVNGKGKGLLGNEYTLTSNTVKIIGDVVTIESTSDTYVERLEARSSTLKSLRFGFCHIEHIDVAGCSALNLIDCKSIEKIYTINAENCKALKSIDCAGRLDMAGVGGYINMINVNGCTSLASLHCENQMLENLDLSGCPNLLFLFCDNNRLKQLDLTRCPLIETLSFTKNYISSLMLPNFSQIYSVKCFDNQLSFEESAKLIASLPVINDSKSSVYYFHNHSDTSKKHFYEEGNRMTKSDVQKSLAKNWLVKEMDDESNFSDYEGLDEAKQAIVFNWGEIKKMETSLSGDVTWTCSDSDVSLVSVDGYVRALNVGKCRLTAKNGIAEESFDLVVRGNSKLIDVEPLVKEGVSFSEIESYETTVAGRKLLTTEEMPGMAGYSLFGFGKDEKSKVIVKYLVKNDKSEVGPYVTMIYDDIDAYIANGMPDYVREYYIHATGEDSMGESFEGYVRGNVGFSMMFLQADDNHSPVVNLLYSVLKTKEINPYDVLLTSEGNEEKKIEIQSPSNLFMVNFGNGWQVNTSKKVKGIPVNGNIKILCADMEAISANLIDLTSVDISSLKNLKRVSFSGNKLKMLDLTFNNKLETIDCSGNRIESLSLKYQTELKDLNASVNLLSKIDLSQQEKLVSLSLLGNQIENIDLSNQHLIEDISLGMNKLANLDLANKPNLYFLILMKNKIKASEMSKIIDQLPQRPKNDGYLKVFFSNDDETPEGNEITKEAIENANAKGWKIKDGSKDMTPEQGITSVENVADDLKITRLGRAYKIYSKEKIEVYDMSGKLLNVLQEGENVLNVEHPIILKQTKKREVIKLL